MRIFSTLVAIGFIIILLAQACSENPTSPAPRPSTEYFPNSPGNWWTYRVHDNLGDSLIGSFRVEIIDTITLGNSQKASVWIYSRDDGEDTSYVSLVGDTLVEVYWDLSGTVMTEMYIIPFVVGTGWPGLPHMNDTVIVIDQTPVSVPGGRFRDAFQVERSWHEFENAGTTTSWMVPYVGLVKKNTGGLSIPGTYDETWELIGYNVSSPK